MNTLASLLHAFDVSSPNALPNLRAASQVFIASDYSGQHSGAGGQVYAYLLIDDTNLSAWLYARAYLRSTYGLGQRRMAFKALGDRKRRDALAKFLTAADQLNGLLFVVRIDKRVGTLFNQNSDVEPSLAAELSGWAPKTLERLLRVSHLGALMLAGLSRPGQNVLWVTDQDDIAANVERHRAMAKIFSIVASHYLEHSLGHLKAATTASDTGQRDLEDLVALPDLAAGAVSQVLDGYGDSEWLIPGFVAPPPALPDKTRLLMSWLADDRAQLKRFVVSIEPGQTPEKIRFRHFKFVATGSSTGEAGVA